MRLLRHDGWKGYIVSTDNSGATEVDVRPELRRWAVEQEVWADPPPLEDLARIAHGRSVRRRALSVVGVVAASAGLWFLLPHVFGADEAISPAGDDTPVITDEYRDMDQVPLEAVERAGIPMIVMADSPSGWTEVGYRGQLVQDPQSGCLMVQGAVGWSEDGADRSHLVWPPGTTVQKDGDTLRVVFASGDDIELGEAFTAVGAIGADAVAQNLDSPSPCASDGDAYLTLYDPGP